MGKKNSCALKFLSTKSEKEASRDHWKWTCCKSLNPNKQPQQPPCAPCEQCPLSFNEHACQYYKTGIAEEEEWEKEMEGPIRITSVICADCTISKHKEIQILGKSMPTPY